MSRRRLVLLLAALALLAPSAAAAEPWAKAEHTLAMDDQVALAATLYEPVLAPPPGGYPAVVMFHGLGGDRLSMNTIAEQVFAQAGYAVLTFDARGHGSSGGLTTIDGPREVQDVRQLHDWLAARPNVDGNRIGTWGISLGGGAVWNSIAAGVPFAASEVVETWVDLKAALMPNNLVKTGAVFGFLNALPSERFAPSVLAIRADAFANRITPALLQFGAERSAAGALRSIETPTLIFQGRRDFAFDLTQGLTAYRLLNGPKRLFIGDFGHAPSTFPGPDAEAVFAESLKWFDIHLRGAQGIAQVPVQLSADPWNGRVQSYGGVPPTTNVTTRLARVNKTFGARGKTVVDFALPARKLETFGAPLVKVDASTRTQAKQLVAVLEAVSPNGTATIVSEGGTALRTGAKSWKLAFRLISDTALIAKGSKLRLTLSWTTTAHSAGNLLYLTGVPDGSSLTIKTAQVTLPVLRQAVSG
jgi:pimeloyl-ACP methyl ester carboxylesterase